MIRILRALAILLPATAFVLLPGAGLAVTAVVNIADDEFRPADVTVEVGDQVIWRWVGDSRHSVFSADGGFASHPDCNTLNRGACGAFGESFVHTFRATGTFTYRCQVHPLRMSGTVTVIPASPGPSPSPSPSPKPEPEPEPEPEPSSEPPPEPTPAPSSPPTLSGPPPPMDTDPLPVIEGEVETPSANPTVAPDIEFEPFVEEPDLPTPTAIDVIVDDGASGSSRTLATGLAVMLLAGWTVFFGREVLFGAPWEDSWLGQPGQ